MRYRTLFPFLVLGVAVAAHAGLLRAPSPNWTLGGVPTRLIEVPAAAPVGVTACPGVRPGAIVESDVGQCTFNFVLGTVLTLVTAPPL